MINDIEKSNELYSIQFDALPAGICARINKIFHDKLKGHKDYIDSNVVVYGDEDKHESGVVVHAEDCEQFDVIANTIFECMPDVCSEIVDTSRNYKRKRRLWYVSIHNPYYTDTDVKVVSAERAPLSDFETAPSVKEEEHCVCIVRVMAENVEEAIKEARKIYLVYRSKRQEDECSVDCDEESKITGIFEQGEKDVYKVTSQDGRVSCCCKEHLWTVRIAVPFGEEEEYIPLSAQMVICPVDDQTLYPHIRCEVHEYDSSFCDIYGYAKMYTVKLFADDMFSAIEESMKRVIANAGESEDDFDVPKENFTYCLIFDKNINKDSDELFGDNDSATNAVARYAESMFGVKPKGFFATYGSSDDEYCSESIVSKELGYDDVSNALDLMKSRYDTIMSYHSDIVSSDDEDYEKG